MNIYIAYFRKLATQHFQSTWMKIRLHFKAKIRTSVSLFFIRILNVYTKKVIRSIKCNHFYQYLVPDTPTAATKTSRGGSAPVVAVPTAIDNKSSQPQAQPMVDVKSLQRENSNESEKEAENERKTQVVCIVKNH